MFIPNLQNHDANDLEAPNDSEVATRLRSILSGFSIEITTREASKIDDFRHYLEEGTEVYIVSTPSTQPEEVVALAKRLRDEDMVPVPHIAARAIASEDKLNRWLENLNRQAEIRAALVIAGGNYDQPLGPYSSSMSLVNSGILERHGIGDLRFAGHPEGHPAVGNADLMNALLEKQQYGERRQLPVSLVTQFFFDFAPVAEWAQQLSRSGICLPVKVGLHGVSTLSGLIKQARFCGVGASIETLAKHPAKMLRLAAVATPDNLVLSLVKHSMSTEQTYFSGCHLFSLGNFEKTARWASALAGGNFELDSKGNIKLNAGL
ncbi:MAG: hypothetical protein JXR97_14035 [Planctomycetes bacterium]|nr:hypothetical protein [Planctomycetota bacterium]